ncbi:MAG: hypothetical protein R3F43_13995 [bacterium]
MHRHAGLGRQPRRAAGGQPLLEHLPAWRQPDGRRCALHGHPARRGLRPPGSGRRRRRQRPAGGVFAL